MMSIRRSRAKSTLETCKALHLSTALEENLALQGMVPPPISNKSILQFGNQLVKSDTLQGLILNGPKCAFCGALEGNLYAGPR